MKSVAAGHLSISSSELQYHEQLSIV